MRMRLRALVALGCCSAAAAQNASECKAPTCFCDVWCRNLATQGAQEWMADFNNVSRAGSVDYWAVKRGQSRFARGEWSWLDFNPAGTRDLVNVQLLYSSAMGRTCVRNLTIHLAGGMEQCTRSRGDSWNWGTWHMANCTMHMAAWATRTVDLVNERRPDDGACLQITVTPFDGPLAAATSRRTEVLNARRYGPPKHAMILTGADGDMALESSILMNALDIPHISVSAVTAGAEHFYDSKKFPLTVQLWPRWRDSVLVFLQQTAPSRVAFVRQDNQICNSAAQALVPMAAQRGIEIAQTSIIQYNTDSGQRPANWAAAAAAVASLKASKMRYIWYCGDAPLLAVLLCEASRADYVGPHVQWHAVGSLAFSAITLTVPTNNCSLPQMINAAESGGFLWAMYTTGFSFLPYLDQLLVPQAAEAIDMSGSPWPEDGSRSLAATPRPGCADDPEGLRRTADRMPQPGLRALLRQQEGDLLTCRDLVRGGFCDAPLGFLTAAAFCPISCCQDNKYSYGCRVSCACTEPPEVTDLRNSTLCVANETWRLPEGWFSRPLAEVKSWSPRQLHVLPAGTTQWKASAEAMVLASTEPRASQLGDASKNGLMFFNSCYYSDGLVAFYLAFEWMERNISPDVPDRVADQDAAMALAVIRQGLEAVDFHGFSGRVRFKDNARVLGTAFMDTWNGRWSNQIFKRDPNGKPFVGGIYNFLAGVVVGNRSVIALRDYGRNVSACRGQANRALALDLCVGEGNSLFWHWTQQDLTKNVPLPGPTLCEAGQYPLAVGEVSRATDVDTCAPCPPGTAKAEADRGRCVGCPAGFHQPLPGKTACVPCPRGSISPPPNSTLVGRYREAQTLGAATCLSCPPGHMADLAGSSRCTSCGPGTFAATAGSSGCERCPRGTYQPAAGATACELCPGRRATLGTGAFSVSDCVCPRDYVMLASGECGRCNPDYATCPGGNQHLEITARQRFFLAEPREAPQMVNESGMLLPLLSEVPLVYKCRDNEACPGNMPPGRCPPGHAGLLCGDCLEGYAPSWRGCVKCNRPLGDRAVGGGLLALAVFLGGGVMALGYPVLNTAETAHTSMVRFIAFVLGICANAAMVLSLLQHLPVQWPSVVSGPQSAFKVLFFDSDVMRVSCFVHQTPVDRVLVRFWIPIAVVGVYGISMLVGALRWISIDKLINCVGYFLTLCFLPFAMNALEIFNCYSHPPPNENLSVVSMPSVLCFGDLWRSQLLVWGILGLLIYPIGLGVLITYLTCAAPSLVMSNQRWLLRLKFLYTRFRYDCWWWGLLLIVRDAFLSVFTTVVAGNAFAQTMLVALVLLFYQHLLLHFRPWRTELQLRLDSALSFLLTVLAICGAAFAEQLPMPLLSESDTKTFEWGILQVVIGIPVPLAAVLLVVAMALGLRLGKVDQQKHGGQVKLLLGTLKDLSAEARSATESADMQEALEANASKLVHSDLSFLLDAIELLRRDVLGVAGARQRRKIVMSQPSDTTKWAGLLPSPQRAASNPTRAWSTGNDVAIDVIE